MTRLDGKDYPDVNHWDCRPQVDLHGVMMPIHSDEDENGRCARCGTKSYRRLMREDLERRRP